MNARPQSIPFPKEDAEKRKVRAQKTATFLAGLDVARAWELIVRPFRHARSNQQNRYLRGAATDVIARAIGYENEEMHEYLCGEHWGWKTRACPKTPNNPNGIRDEPVRTTTRNEAGERDVLNKRDFWDFVEFVQRFGAQHGIYIQDPDPEYLPKEDNKEKAA